MGGAHGLTSELPGKMGWFMLHLLLCKVPGPLLEVSDTQVTCQDRHAGWFWKARETNGVMSPTRPGDQESKVRWSLRKIGYLDPGHHPIGQARWVEEGEVGAVGVLALVPHSQHHVEVSGTAHHQCVQAVGGTSQVRV